MQLTVPILLIMPHVLYLTQTLRLINYPEDGFSYPHFVDEET